MNSLKTSLHDARTTYTSCRAEPGSSGVRQGQSPLIIAGLLGGAATVGGLILMDAAETGEQVLNSVPALDAVKATTGGLDENTKTLLQVWSH